MLFVRLWVISCGTAYTYGRRKKILDQLMDYFLIGFVLNVTVANNDL